MPKNDEILKPLRKVKKSKKIAQGSPKGAPDANDRLLLVARVPRAVPRDQKSGNLYQENRKIGNREKGKEEGSNTPMGQRPGEFFGSGDGTDVDRRGQTWTDVDRRGRDGRDVRGRTGRTGRGRGRTGQ